MGLPIKIIDTDTSITKRWYSLPVATRQALERNRHGRDLLRIKSPDFGLGEVRWGRGTLGPDTDTYLTLQEALWSSIQEGYHCFDEMFVWANDMVDKKPCVPEVIRDRFPLLFIDEAQDNSEDQSALLHRIFMDGGGEVLRQRLGDSNQAIYNFVGARGASTDPFPSGDTKSMPNSHRFGPGIATLAEPFGVAAHEGGLKGNGPKLICLDSTASEGIHTIFLFDESTVEAVLPAYAELLIETFSEKELNDGEFVAVGQVHNPPKQARTETNPHFVGQYWPQYDPGFTKADPIPKTFVQYIRAGQAKATAEGETQPAVERIAQGILHLAGMATGGRHIRRRKRNHRHVLGLLSGYTDSRSCYTVMVDWFSAKNRPPKERSWNSRWSKAIRQISERIAETSLSSHEVDAFLSWEDPSGESGAEVTEKRSHGANIFCFPADVPKVRIKVGSIHSVKGQTHTATLVLETFWYKHNLADLKRWLLGSKSGGRGVGERQQSRLRLHYVAMTRPTHLLCLAMRRSSFENDDGELDSAAVNSFELIGWRVREV